MRTSIFSTFFKDILASSLILAFFIAPLTPVFAQETIADPVVSLPETTSPNTDTTSTPNIPDTSGDSTLDVDNSNANENTVLPEEISPTAPKEEQMMEMSSFDTANPENLTTGLVKTSKNILKTDETTGALNYSYDIVIPPGRNGMQSDIKLNYNNQQAGNYPNPIGYGWNINIPSIERVNKTGTDKLYTANYFYSSLSGELALVSGVTYAPKVENGDFIKYEYYKDAGQIYSSKVKYTGNGSTDGNFEVEFLRESRADITKSYATTFLVQTNYRINEIKTKVNGIWARRYMMSYVTGDNGVRSLLGSIIESGQDENFMVTTLPATSFTYYATDSNTRGWTLDITTWTAPKAMGDALQSFLDVNGDALPDIIESYTGPYGDEKHVRSEE